MRASRAACLMVLGLLASSCTEPNPGYDPGTVPCEPGVRSCDGNKLMVCVDSSPPALQLERVCPAPSVCEQDQCAINSDPCPPACAGSLVCAVFAVAGTLGTYCALPATTGLREPGQQCAQNEQCQSGLCVTGGKNPVCFRPCAAKNRECPTIQPAVQHCIDAKVTVNGVAGTVPACVP